MENYRFELKNAAITVEMALSSSKMMPAFFYTAHFFFQLHLPRLPLKGRDLEMVDFWNWAIFWHVFDM